MYVSTQSFSTMSDPLANEDSRQFLEFQVFGNTCFVRNILHQKTYICFVRSIVDNTRIIVTTWHMQHGSLATSGGKQTAAPQESAGMQRQPSMESEAGAKGARSCRVCRPFEFKYTVGHAREVQVRRHCRHSTDCSPSPSANLEPSPSRRRVTLGHRASSMSPLSK